MAKDLRLWRPAVNRIPVTVSVSQCYSCAGPLLQNLIRTYIGIILRASADADGACADFSGVLANHMLAVLITTTITQKTTAAATKKKRNTNNNDGTNPTTTTTTTASATAIACAALAAAVVLP